MAVMSNIPKTLAKLGTKNATGWVEENSIWLKRVIDKHLQLLKDQEVAKYQAAYDGKLEAIDLRDKARGDGPNSKLYVNLSQLIIDTVVDYLIAKPPVYTIEDNEQADGDVKEAPLVAEYRKEILALLQKESAQLALSEQLRQGSIGGYSVIIAWVDEDGEIDFSEFPIQEAIPVYNDRGKLKMFIRRYEVASGENDSSTTTKLEIYDEQYIMYLTGNETGDGFILDDDEVATGNPVEHMAGRIPVSVFINASAASYEVRVKRAGTSDLGNGTFSLLEAYAHGLSDKANLADYLQDQYLLLKGVDTDEKEVLKMRKARAIALKSAESDASFIAQSQEDTAVENYLIRLRDTIHDVTFTPKINDLQGATATEIKMKYAPLDIKAGKKELFFLVAIIQLVEVLTDLLNAKKLSSKSPYTILSDKAKMAANTTLYKAEWLTLKLNRNLPQNFKEIADIVAELSGKVADSYLIELLWFVDDPIKAIAEFKAQQAATAKLAADASIAAMGYGSEFGTTGAETTTV